MLDFLIMPHIHEKIDFTSEVFVVYEDKVLLRIHDKLKKWLSVGGHIELNEDPNIAAVREVKEEVGLDIELFGNKNHSFNSCTYQELIPPKYLNRHRINENHEHVTLVYFAKSSTDKLIPSKTEIADDCRWFTREELDSKSYDIMDHVKFYAKKALEELSSN